MSNDYYTASGTPATRAQGSSAAMRGELAAIVAAFDKLPGLSGNGLKTIRVNSGGSGLEAATPTGTGAPVNQVSPALTTPNIGVAAGTSLALTGLAAANQLQSTVTTGTAPLVVASATKVVNLYADRAALADTVTTNANLTGVVTSVGNATSFAGGTTGSGAVVLATSPTLVAPNIGAATGASLSVSGQLTSTVATGTAPLAVSSTTKVSNLYVDRAALADTVTFNANLGGVVTSVGNTTSFASSVGSGAVVLGTANSPAWTPAPSSQTGFLGSTTLNAARFWKYGALTFFTVDFTINVVNTGGGGVNVPLPSTPVNTWQTPRGRDINLGGGLMGIISPGSPNLLILNDANGSPILANARLQITGFYE